MDPEHLYDAWLERAAVRAYDGGLSFDEAERLAWEDILTTWLPAQTTLEVA